MVDSMSDMSDSIARENARQEAEKAVKHDLSGLINPSDLIHTDDDVTEWSDVDDDTLNMEISESVSIMRSEQQSPYAGIAHDTAIVLCRNDMHRAPMSDLAFNSKAKAVKNGYWPNGTNRYEVTELIRENKPDHFDECEREAWEYVSSGIHDGLDPRDN